MKALVVDDEKDIVDEVCDFLKRKGHEVVGAGGVDEARRSLDVDGPFDVVLTDMRMPPGTGLDVIEACNQMSEPRPAMYLLTGQASAEQIGEAAKAGVASVLSKPVAFRALLEIMTKAGSSGGSTGTS